AVKTSQSSVFAFGKNLRSSFILSSLDINTCWIEYLINGMFFIPAAAIVNTLLNLRCLKKSTLDPYFKSFGPQAANGPNNKASLPSIYRLSKGGTVIGGVPSGSLPYTFA